MDEPLGPVAAALAAAIVVKDEQLALPEEAVELARRALLREPSEDALVDIAALRAKTARVAGERGAAVCALLDALVDAGAAALDADESRMEHGTAPDAATLGGVERPARAPLTNAAAPAPTAARPRRGIPKASREP